MINALPQTKLRAMGGLANLYWRDSESSADDFTGAPGFESDSKLWADWIAAMHAEERDPTQVGFA